MKPATYSVVLTWSDDDEAYVADVLELPGCMAHGETRQEAIAQAEIAIDNWLDTAREIGRDIPRPKHLADYEKLVNQSVAERRQEIQDVAKKVLTNSLPTISERLAEYLARSGQNVAVSYHEGEGIRTLREAKSGHRVARRDRKLSGVLKHRSVGKNELHS
jgi:predicted RNase H-like HicB family nuclease